MVGTHMDNNGLPCLGVKECIGHRRRLPARRASHTVKFNIGGQTCFLTCGEYADGTLGEVFVIAAKVGSALRSFVDAWSIMVSKSLQYGMPVADVVDTFLNFRFEPNGPVVVDEDENPAAKLMQDSDALQDGFNRGDCPIKYAASILDFVARYIAWQYLKRTEVLVTSPIEQL